MAQFELPTGDDRGAGAIGRFVRRLDARLDHERGLRVFLGM